MRSRGKRRRTWGTCAAAACLAATFGATPAFAGTLLERNLTVADAADRDCIERPLQGRGIARETATVGGVSWITAQLDAASGDWDLGVFDASTGRRVIGSAYRGGYERASGFALAGSRLTVQACRRSGSARTARLSLSAEQLEKPAEPERLSIVRVLIPNRQRRSDLTDLNLDLTEHGGRNFVEVVLHGERDARALRKAGFIYTTETRDVVADSLADRRADSRAVAARLPSGRTGSYRRLADYSNEMKALARQNPSLVKPITLRQRTLTGKPVEGIEVTENASARDGKPVFLQMGAHHAREWPSAEHAMEWAYELVNGYKANNARVRGLMGKVRTIVVPVVNPEGFEVSREAGQTNGVGGGRPSNDTVETGNLLIPREYQRKNCRVNNPDGDDPEEGNCNPAPPTPQTGLSQFGTDPNRNYGGFWGGPGADPGGPAPFGDFAQDYRGDGPFSERETQNVRDLVASRQVTTLITNHTFSNLVLRPPGIRAQGPPVDEGIYKALGDSMAQNNAYTSQPSYDLYDTTGGTEDWTYYSTGGLGYTFEIGLNGFHPPYGETIAEYEGTAPASGAGQGGNREAYFKAMENTANPARHSVISGTAGAGNVLRLYKTFKTATSPVLDAQGVEGNRILFDDVLNSTMQVPGSGSYELHANPSTRPIREVTQGRAATGSASPPATLATNAPPPVPPCPATQIPTCIDDIPVTVPTGSGVDNAKATFEVKWDTAASDYDIEVYEDTDNNGVDTGDPELGTSAQGTTNFESTTVGDGEAQLNGKRLILRVVNFAGAEPYDAKVSYRGPDPFEPAAKESWRLTCETPSGQVLATRSVQIDRGQARQVDFGSSCPAASPAGPGGGGQAGGGSGTGASGCATGPAGARGTRLGPARLGRSRSIQRRNLGRRLRSPSAGIDRYCLAAGGVLRVGYPTARLNRSLRRSTRRRLRNRAILVLTSSRRFPLSRATVGMSTRTLRRRLRGERSVVVGRNRWYFTSASKSRLLFRVQRGKVREVGLAAGSITRSRLRTARLLRAWDGRG